MAFLGALLPLLAEIAPTVSVAGTGIGLGLDIAGAGKKPPTPTLPAQSINPAVASQVSANQQASVPGISQGYIDSLIAAATGGNQYTTGVGSTNSSGNFVPAGSAAGAGDTTNQNGLTLIDYLNQAVQGGPQ